jgi:hypothetical protein
MLSVWAAKHIMAGEPRKGEKQLNQATEGKKESEILDVDQELSGSIASFDTLYEKSRDRSADGKQFQNPPRCYANDSEYRLSSLKRLEHTFEIYCCCTIGLSKIPMQGLTRNFCCLPSNGNGKGRNAGIRHQLLFQKAKNTSSNSPSWAAAHLFDFPDTPRHCES